MEQPAKSSPAENRKLSITELVLRDGHQSLLATRMRLDDMLPIAEKMDRIGYWSVESWGGATFDACLRFLGEDPWERIREISKAMPNTQQQMLLRGQNILGYRHYANDVVDKFVERARENGVTVFRIFDALNDMHNLAVPIKSVLKHGGHAQGTLSYTISPYHTMASWIKQAKDLESIGAQSLAIKDMSGLLRPYVAFELVQRIKQETKLRVHLHCHATTGLSTATAVKAAEAGVDTIDTSIASMSMTYGHSSTEAVVAIFSDTPYETGLELSKLVEISDYFRLIRKKYAKFEGTMRGVDPRILQAQVPGGMMSNLENQLREQNLSEKLDEVLREIPKVREDLGYVPLVTPSSQIVGTQAVMNVITGERYKTITKETAGVVRGEYGRPPGPLNQELVEKVLAGEEAPVYDPSSLAAELPDLTAELAGLAKLEGFKLAKQSIDDVLSYALFPQVALKYFKNRHNPAAFEPAPEPAEPSASPAAPADPSASAAYDVKVNGKSFLVEVSTAGAQTVPAAKSTAAAVPPATSPPAAATPAAGDVLITAPLAGNVFKLLVQEGQQVKEGEVLLLLEAMKMESEVCSTHTGTVTSVHIREGDAVAVGAKLVSIRT